MVDLYPHQRDAVNKMHNGCILWGGVGTGKSRTAVAYYLEREAPKDVYVITTARKRDALDWDTEFVRYGVGTEKGATVAGVLRTDSWNNIAKYKNVKGAFFIFDEQRLVGSGAWVKAFKHIAKNNNWVLLSATPGDTWMDYVPVFVANGFYKNKTEFVAQHVEYDSFSKFPKIKQYHNVGKLIKHRASLLVHMEFVHEAEMQTINIPVQFDEVGFKRLLKDRWNPFTDKPIKNVSEFFACMRRITYSHESRLEAVKKILREEEPRLIIFYNFDYELEELRKLYDVEGLTVAEWNGHKHEEVPETERWAYLVQYVAGAEAWNCITTRATLFYSLTYSYRVWRQAHGRTSRLNTPFKVLRYYVLLSNSAMDRAVMAALRQKRDFNESSFAKKKKAA
ncbi:DNA helicase [Streptomyces phage Scap1]|uniref:DNA helicase n=1 Tax=Streptomyces phage Scap1 TaxID=2041354 RepID=A0A2D1GNW7_9CAUD|nr:DNA helicase [Streptomyces phage Scap1]ATN93700.1 DNA helicase [Streptomyces phage Scap1]